MGTVLISVLASCVCALLVTVFACSRLVRRLQKRFSLRPSVQLSGEMSQLRSDLDSISVTVRRLHAKYGMRAVRGQRAAEAASSSVERQPTETRAAWKLRVQRQLRGE